MLSWEPVRTCVLFDAVSVPHSPAPPDELWPHWPKLVPSAPSELKQLAWASNAAMRILITTDYSVHTVITCSNHLIHGCQGDPSFDPLNLSE